MPVTRRTPNKTSATDTPSSSPSNNNNNNQSSSMVRMTDSHYNKKPSSTMTVENSASNANDNVKIEVSESGEDMKPLLMEPSNLEVDKGADTTTTSTSASSNNSNSNNTALHPSAVDAFFAKHFHANPEFWKSVFKFILCFAGLQASYLTWGYMQELIMTTKFEPTPRVPTGMFPSAAFCVFSNRFLAVLVAMVAVRLKHGAVFSNNVAPLLSFTPCSLSNTMSSWSQYASLKYVSFPVQTVFKSSKIIPVMIMGKVLKGTIYPSSQYIEALLITVGVAIFSLLSKSSDKDTETELLGLVFLVMYISFDSFTSQWQSRIYVQYGKENVDPYQMMLGVNVSAICITTAGLILTGDIPIVWEFLVHNPVALRYNIITAITSASGQLCIFYTIKEFGPIVFTIIMTTRQMISICISAVVFGHTISWKAGLGAVMVFGVLFYQIRNKYNARNRTKAGAGSS